MHLSVQLVVHEDDYPVPEVESWSSLKRSIGHGKGYLSIHHSQTGQTTGRLGSVVVTLLPVTQAVTKVLSCSTCTLAARGDTFLSL